ncbi:MULTISPECIES: hypothetical protein [unclassified Streptomyces]|uniref:hypothetical protein n=1 Tax=unclassified Streptomyces TaxID=2593676 RepID=UPI000DBA6550|nr:MULTISPECIES: hypothetical protein [unclassified Streptomyces]MYT73379.1 hypothetical protein [Streptomyces sp. SID8367]RAJ70597.1 hypothetical protein K377_07936 [Streptomyces sp. PsTaAH-137]
MDLTITLHDETATLAPHGDIDGEQLDDLNHYRAGLPTEVTEVVWNLRDVPFLCIAALHLLDPSTPHLSITVVNIPPQPLRLLNLAHEQFPRMGWDRHLPDPRETVAA